jgi:hypothetical protein
METYIERKLLVSNYRRRICLSIKIFGASENIAENIGVFILDIQ